jgi:hypothetical protein
MKKSILTLMIGIFFLLMLFVNFVNAELQYYQQRYDRGNGSIENRATLSYSKIGLFGFGSDYVKGNNPLEVYLQYNIYVKTFNENNPNYQVDYCNLKIQVSRQLEGSVDVTVFEQNYTEEDADINKAQYFYQLYNGDQAIAVLTCNYRDLSSNNTAIRDLQLPAEMQMVMPTSECKACQYYLWTKQSVDVEKTKSVGSNIISITNYIQRLVVLNFEVILALFWIFLILMLFVGIGLIFIGIYWLFLYLRRVSK